MARRLLMHSRMASSRVSLPALLAIATVAAMGCSGSVPRIVPLLRTSGAPITPTPSNATPLESRKPGDRGTRSAARSRLGHRLRRSRGALGIAVSTATGPWAEAHRDYPVAHHGGWTVLVEVIGADAELESAGASSSGWMSGRRCAPATATSISARRSSAATRAGLRSAEEGAPVIYRCMMRIGRDLAGWLGGGVRLDPPPPEAGYRATVPSSIELPKITSLPTRGSTP